MSNAIDNASWPWNSILVLRRQKVLYTPIAKNANTSLKRLIVGLSGHPQTEEILAGSVHDYLAAHWTGLVLGDLPREKANRILNDRAYFHFAVLRNPLDRVVSGYVEKFVATPVVAGALDEVKDIIGPAIESVYAARGEQPDYRRSITFAEFADYLARTPDDQLDTHFKSQGVYLEQQRLDHVFTIERMDRLVARLEPILGRTLELEWRNRSAYRRRVLRYRRRAHQLPMALCAERRLPHASELLTREIAGRLKKRYAADFQRWRRAARSA